MKPAVSSRARISKPIWQKTSITRLMATMPGAKVKLPRGVLRAALVQVAPLAPGGTRHLPYLAGPAGHRLPDPSTRRPAGERRLRVEHRPLPECRRKP